MKPIHAISLGLLLGAVALPAGAAQSASHEHPAPTPEAAATPTPAQASKPMAGMGCDPDMHARMEKRMEHMESMMAKMHGATGAGSHPDAKPSTTTPEHEHGKE